MPIIERPNASVAYDIVGSGPTVLLGHSLFCTRSMWDGVIRSLCDEYRFINVELRGHRDSTASGPFTLNDLVDDWLAILNRESVEQVILCGLSTGGMTAMRFALRAPERTLGLALLDTSADPEPLLNRIKNSFLAFLYLRLNFLPEKALLEVMFDPDTLEGRPDMIRSFLDDFRRFHKKDIHRAMRAVFGRDALDMTPIDLPTLVIVGEHDRATPFPCARTIAHRIAGARLETVRNAGHLTTMEQPEAVADLLRPFFASCRTNIQP